MTMDTSTKNKKVKQYEDYIELTLKEDLKEIEQILNRKVDSYKEWDRLKQFITVLRLQEETEEDTKIELPLGSGISVTCKIFNTDTIYVDIGLGSILPMNYNEANQYADVRMRLLKKEIDHYQKLAIAVKVNIKLTLLAINELINL